MISDGVTWNDGDEGVEECETAISFDDDCHSYNNNSSMLDPFTRSTCGVSGRGYAEGNERVTSSCACRDEVTQNDVSLNLLISSFRETYRNVN
jgi:hypothetical protein